MVSFSLVGNIYLSNGLATRRATKIGMNMCLSFLKNACEPISNKIANARACKTFQIWTLSTEIFIAIKPIYFKKSLLAFFQKASLNYAKAKYPF